jgi:hypothetical protein
MLTHPSLARTGSSARTRLGRLARVLPLVLACSAFGAIGSEEYAQPGVARGQIDLRPRFEKGEALRYEMRSTSRAESTLQGPEATPELETSEEREQVLELVFRVLDSDPEAGSKLEILIDRASLRITSDAYTGFYDTGATSRTPSRPAPAKRSNTPSQKPPPGTRGIPDLGLDALLGGMTDESLKATVQAMVGGVGIAHCDAAGRITRIDPHPGGPGLATSSLAGGGAGGGGGGGGGGSLLDRSGIAIPFGDLLVSGHPTGVVGRNETWTSADRLGAQGVGVGMTTRYRVLSAGQATAKIGFEGTIEPSGSTPQPGMPLGLGLQSGSHNGSFEWDTRSGSLVSMDVRSEISIDLGGFRTRLESSTGVRRQR